MVEVDGGSAVDLPRWMLPPGAREGDVLLARPEPGEDGMLRLHLRIDDDATRAARASAAARLERLRARDPGGDVQL